MVGGQPQSSMPEEPEHPYPELTLHVFTVAAAMVGVCLTGIGLFRIYGGAAFETRLGDDLLAVDATLFAVVCFLRVSLAPHSLTP